LGLLFATDGLIGVAIEGFSTEDRGKVSKAANEVADAVLYFGDEASLTSK
jgi:hypothetical protein